MGCLFSKYELEQKSIPLIPARPLHPKTTSSMQKQIIPRQPHRYQYQKLIATSSLPTQSSNTTANLPNLSRQKASKETVSSRSSQQPKIIYVDEQEVYFRQINQQFQSNPVKIKLPSSLKGIKEYPVYYPFPHQFLRNFCRKPNPDQKTHNFEYILSNFSDKLNLMKKYGYDFKQCNWKFKPSGKDNRIFWSQTKLMAYSITKCQNQQCKFNNLNNKKLRLLKIHTYDTVELNFLVTDLFQFLDKYPKYQQNFGNIDKLKYNKCVQWQMKFLNDECKVCGKFSKSAIYDSQIEAIFQFFCYEIASKIDEEYERELKLKAELEAEQKQRQRIKILNRKKEKQQEYGKTQLETKKRNFSNPFQFEDEGQLQNQSQKDFQEGSRDADADNIEDENSEEQYSYQGQNQDQDQQDQDQQDQEKQWDQDQQEQFEEEKLIHYPYSREQIDRLFRQKDTLGQSIYNIEQSEQYITQQLEDMQQYGYDFRIEPCWNFQSKSKSNRHKYIKKMKRKLYIRNKCNKCVDQNGNKKTWTSILGVGQVNFMVDDLQQFFHKNPQFQSDKKTPAKQAKGKKYPLCIRWNLQIYRMKCKECNRWGQTFIYQKQLQALAKSFCLIVAEIAEEIEVPKKHKDNRYKLRQVHKHEESLCEACQRGECFNIAKGASKILQR